jgi:hypothetical protein
LAFSTGFYRVKAILTLLFVSAVIDLSPDSKRAIVLAEIPAFLASSALRNPNFTRVFSHQFTGGILEIYGKIYYLVNKKTDKTGQIIT